MMLFPIILSTVIISLISLIGIFFLFFKTKILENIIFVLIAFAAGTMIGTSFFHLIPEAVEAIPILTVSLLLIGGFSFFFLLERLFYWRHCHEGTCKIHPVGYLNLIGDGIHNFLDGILIAASYLVSLPLGIFTSIAIIAHEVPQELGDFGVLLKSGFSKQKALSYNFLVASISILGAFLGWLFLASSNMTLYLLPIIAGNFLYIATADLIPELHKEKSFLRTIQSFLAFVFGLAVMYGLLFLG